MPTGFFYTKGGASLNCIKIIVVIEARETRGTFITTEESVSAYIKIIIDY